MSPRGEIINGLYVLQNVKEDVVKLDFSKIERGKSHEIIAAGGNNDDYDAPLE